MGFLALGVLWRPNFDTCCLEVPLLTRSYNIASPQVCCRIRQTDHLQCDAAIVLPFRRWFKGWARQVLRIELVNVKHSQLVASARRASAKLMPLTSLESGVDADVIL